MKHGRTSFIDFASKIAMSVTGFVATVYLTRTLGANKYGTYVLVLSVLAWVAIGADFGLSTAVRKRVSESVEGNYIAAGAASQLVLYTVASALLWVFRDQLNGYLEVEATTVIIGLLAVKLLTWLVSSVLEGQHKVHISSLLSPIDSTIRSVLQIALVVAGYGLAGAFAGYVIGALVAVAVGAYFISFSPGLPTREDFGRIRSYAQFSWLGMVKGRAFVSMDTVILALFVTNSVIAVYEVAWNLASLFAIFGASIARTLFPEMSKIASGGDPDGDREVSELLRISLSYAGLFLIPGIIGSAIVGDIVLTIYGAEFVTGYYILIVLAFARLLYSYKQQFISMIDALDYPEKTFQINAVFVAVNLSLNLILAWAYGWYGAAAATTISSGVGLLLGYYYARELIDVTVPFTEVGKQLIAGGLMAVVVVGGRLLVGESLAVVVVLVTVGGGTYFAALWGLSSEFRTTVASNLPI